MVDSKYVVPGVFLSLILLGFVLTTWKTERAHPSKNTVDVSATPLVENTGLAEKNDSPNFIEESDPWSVPLLESVAADVSGMPVDPFAALLPVAEATSAVVEPAVAQNGNTTSPDIEPIGEPVDEPVGVSLTGPLAETVDVPVVESVTEPVDETVVETVVDPIDWVPFVCVYRPSHGQKKSDWVYYFFPMSDVLSEEEAKKPENVVPPMQTSLIPIVYAPVPILYPMSPVCPIQQMPVYFPTVVQSRIGKTPKWVYPNGVVVKPKVYLPGRPLRNAARAVTP